MMDGGGMRVGEDVGDGEWFVGSVLQEKRQMRSMR
jgi:hypothetical protein